MMKKIKPLTIDKETLRAFVGGYGPQPDEASFSGACNKYGVCTYGCPSTYGTVTCGSSPCSPCT